MIGEPLRRLGVVLAFIPALSIVSLGIVLGAVAYVLWGAEAGERVMNFFCTPLDRVLGVDPS